MNLEPLFTPFKFKNLILRNRFVMAPMTRAQSPDGVPNKAVEDYYTRRAKAEVGLILTEGTVIDRLGSKNAKDIPNFYGQQALQAWKGIVDNVHVAGAAIAPQIWHVGNVIAGDWLPESGLEGPNTMSNNDILQTISAFADAARAANDLGFDAVEIHGAHGYLIDQFFCDRTNLRDDRWGGKTLKERSRFALEVITAIRAAVGLDTVIILRLSNWKQKDYTVKLAANPQELADWVLPLAEAGVDIFHGSQRRYWEAEFEGSELNFAGWLKKITGKPTITVGSVGLSSDMVATFAQGEGAEVTEMSELMRRFNRGDFDLVAVGRNLLQDPIWVQKIKDKRFSDLKAFHAASMKVLY